MGEARLQTPVDYETGLPLPIAPKIRRIPLKRPEIADWHHQFHPRSDPRLHTIGGIALRNSRQQLVARELHNEGPNTYHSFFEGPPIPTSKSIQFGMCILNCAGYIPEEGILLKGDEPKVVRLNHNQRNILRAHKEDNFDYRHFRYGYDPLRTFFIEFALEQDYSIIDQSILEQFLNSNDLQIRRNLGQIILQNLIVMATDSIDKEYCHLRVSDKLHPLMPNDSMTLVKYKLGSRSAEEELLVKLEDSVKLAVAA